MDYVEIMEKIMETTISMYTYIVVTLITYYYHFMTIASDQHHERRAEGLGLL